MLHIRIRSLNNWKVTARALQGEERHRGRRGVLRGRRRRRRRRARHAALSRRRRTRARRAPPAGARAARAGRAAAVVSESDEVRAETARRNFASPIRGGGLRRARGASLVAGRGHPPRAFSPSGCHTRVLRAIRGWRRAPPGLASLPGWHRSTPATLSQPNEPTKFPIPGQLAHSIGT